MDRTRLTLLLGAVVVVVVGAVVVASRGGGDEPPDVVTAEPSDAPSDTVAEATPVPTTIATTTSAPETTIPEPLVGEHPICAAWDTFLAEGDGLGFDTPEEIRIDNERHLAFYSAAVELLEGAEREAAAGLLAHHQERAAFWPRWGWDFDAYLLESSSDPDLPAVPWPTTESADGWRETLTNRCGLEFEIEEGA